MGIGKGINPNTLQQIAGANNPVVMVDNFDKLQEKIQDIKSKACSGKWSKKVAGDSGFLVPFAVWSLNYGPFSNSILYFYWQLLK